MLKLAILVSGRGSNMRAIINACEQDRLKATVELVISNNCDAEALSIAREKGISTLHLSSKTHSDPEKLDQTMMQYLQQREIDLVLLAGFMKKIGSLTQSAFHGKILNIHPSLLPKFGGKGMYGLHVHKAVIAAREKESGVTIHLVDGEYDEGKILAQETLKVAPGESPEALAARILEIEHKIYTETIQKIIEGSIILPSSPN